MLAILGFLIGLVCTAGFFYWDECHRNPYMRGFQEGYRSAMEKMNGNARHREK